VGVGGGYALGQKGGEVSHTLISPEMPAHTHQMYGSTDSASSNAPTGNVFAQTSGNSYGTGTTVALNQAIVPSFGGSQPHENRQPFTVLNYCIATQGIFPSRN
jgi:microcystin-dependent protein